MKTSWRGIVELHRIKAARAQTRGRRAARQLKAAYVPLYFVWKDGGA